MGDDHPVTETAEAERETARFVALFLFGVILFSPLVVRIFDVPGISVFGIPLLYAYLFAGWALLILIAARLAGRIMTPAPPKPRPSSAAEG